MSVKRAFRRIVSLGLLAAGTALVASFLMGYASPGNFNVPEVAAAERDGASGGELSLTVPKMPRVEGVRVPNAAGGDTEQIGGNAAIHLQGTGFPWEEGANTYIAGHRLGYAGTDSFLAFYDLDKLRNGDEVFLTDKDGTEYSYRVFRTDVVDPSEVGVTEPVPGKSVVTLQTCTLPDFSKRLVVQAELVSVS